MTSDQENKREQRCPICEVSLGKVELKSHLVFDHNKAENYARGFADGAFHRQVTST